MATDRAPPQAPAAAPPVGVVHSLAYSPYAGPRRSPSFAPLVIARFALMTQLRQRGVQVALLLGVIVATITAAVQGVRWSFSSMVGSRSLGHGAPDPAALLRSAEHSVGPTVLQSQFLPSFLLMLWCGAGAISSDLMAGAFQFHFSRPVSPGRYLAGRVLSSTGWAFALSLLALSVLSVERLAFQSTPLGAATAFGVGLVAVLLRLASLAALALGASSLTRRKGLAQAMFAAVVLAGFAVTQGVGAVLEEPWVQSVDLLSCVTALVDQINGESALHGARAAAPALAWLAWTAGPLGLAAWRLAHAEVTRG